MLDNIAHWLANYDYLTGLQIYQECIGNNVLYSIISKCENSFTKQKLIGALEQKQQELQQEAATRAKNKPEEILDQERTAQSLMNERAELKALLRNQYFERIDNTESRTAAVLRIAAIRSELDKCFMNIQLFNDQGVIIKRSDEFQEETDDLRELLNLRSYETKYQKALDNNLNLRGKPLSLELKEKYTIKLGEFRIRLQQLEKANNHAVYIGGDS